MGPRMFPSDEKSQLNERKPSGEVNNVNSFVFCNWAKSVAGAKNLKRFLLHLVA